MSHAPSLEYASLAAATEGRKWVHRLALALAGLTFVLIVAGANVTSKNVGLAVPDWPLSFNSINPPGWTTNMGGTQPGVRDEHGHRLLGAATGMVVIALLAAIAVWDRRRWMVGLGVLALAAVIGQGVMGGLRVWEKSLSWAIIHGCFAQAFLCLTIALAMLTSPKWPGGTPLAAAESRANRPLRFWVTALAAAVFGQLILGALVRHTGSSGSTVLHIAGALVVGACVVLAAQHVFARPESEKPLAAPLITILVLFGVQLLLGVVTYVIVLGMQSANPSNVYEAYVPTVHVAIGALILGTSFMAALRTHALTHRGAGSTVVEAGQEVGKA